VITTITIFFPLVGVFVMLLLRNAEARAVRYTALGTAAVPLLLVLYIYFAHGGSLDDPTLSQSFDWIGSLGIGYRVGLDGLGFGMFFLSALLTLIAVVAASWDVRENLRQYFAILFVAELGMLGVFAAQDLILFYIFFEITLIPMYLLVGIWGDENRRPAAIKFFLYTFFGSTIMLAGFLALGILSGANFSMEITNAGALSRTAQIAVAAPILLGLLIKVPAVPLHNWLLDAYVSSPTSTNVMLSGILPKLGTYGLIKIALPLLPQGVEPFLPYVAILGVINIIFGAFVAFMQPDLKALVAYSSIGTLGFILLGISSGNALGINGAVMQQVTHGLYSALLFVLVGIIASRAGTRRIDELGGLAARMPWAGGLLVLGALAAMGVPGLAVFVSEFMSIMGGYTAFPVQGVLAALGILLGAMYLLFMLRRVVFGPIEPPSKRPKTRNR
jgi:proton-translocating NADH-quinone oxidoreductase chain M